MTVGPSGPLAGWGSAVYNLSLPHPSSVTHFLLDKAGALPTVGMSRPEVWLG